LRNAECGLCEKFKLQSQQRGKGVVLKQRMKICIPQSTIRN
jgi:hypothetical protein